MGAYGAMVRVVLGPGFGLRVSGPDYGSQYPDSGLRSRFRSQYPDSGLRSRFRCPGPDYGSRGLGNRVNSPN